MTGLAEPAGPYWLEKDCKCKTERVAKIKLIPRDTQALAPKTLNGRAAHITNHSFQAQGTCEQMRKQLHSLMAHLGMIVLSGTVAGCKPAKDSSVAGGALSTAGTLHLEFYSVPVQELEFFVDFKKPFLRLRVGVGVEDARRQSQWLVDLEDECIEKDGGDREFKVLCEGDIWQAIYNGATRENSAFLDPLAQLFRVGAGEVETDPGKQRQWEIMSVIRYVQSLKKENPTEYKAGLRPPVQVVQRGAGNAVSTSPLAAILLRRFGYRTGVCEWPNYFHVALAVHVDDMPWLKGSLSINGPDNQQYYLIDTTGSFVEPEMHLWERFCNCKREQLKIKLIPRDKEALAPKQR